MQILVQEGVIDEKTVSSEHHTWQISRAERQHILDERKQTLIKAAQQKYVQKYGEASERFETTGIYEESSSESLDSRRAKVLDAIEKRLGSLNNKPDDKNS